MFKLGDTVKCVKTPNPRFLTAGNVYTVLMDQESTHRFLVLSDDADLFYACPIKDVVKEVAISG